VELELSTLKTEKFKIIDLLNVPFGEWRKPRGFKLNFCYKSYTFQMPSQTGFGKVPESICSNPQSIKALKQITLLYPFIRKEYEKAPDKLLREQTNLIKAVKELQKSINISEIPAVNNYFKQLGVRISCESNTFKVETPWISPSNVITIN